MRLLFRTFSLVFPAAGCMVMYYFTSMSTWVLTASLFVCTQLIINAIRVATGDIKTALQQLGIKAWLKDTKYDD